MRYPASEKLEIIRLVEQSHLGVGSTLDKLGIPKTTFYRWYDRFLAFGDAGLEDRNSSPGRVWNRIPDDVRGQIIDLALEETQLSPRELAVRFTDTRGYFVSEASVYRLLKAHDLITSPAFVVIKAADEFRDKTTAPNQLWQTDFTYLKVIGWGWFYHCQGFLVGNLYQHHVTRLTFDQGRDVAVLRSRQQITFPVTRHRPIFDRGRALTDRHHVRDLTPANAFPARLFRASDRALRPKMLKQLLLKHTAGLNKQTAIDRLVRHLIRPSSWMRSLEPSGDLLR